MSVQGMNLIAGGVSLPSSSVVTQSAMPGQQVSSDDQVQKAKQEVTPDVLQKAVDEANRVFEHVRPDIKFVIEEDTQNVVMMLVEPETGDVIKRYPTEQAIAMSSALTKTHSEAFERRELFRNSGEGMLGLIFKQKI